MEREITEGVIKGEEVGEAVPEAHPVASGCTEAVPVALPVALPVAVAAEEGVGVRARGEVVGTGEVPRVAVGGALQLGLEEEVVQAVEVGDPPEAVGEGKAEAE